MFARWDEMNAQQAAIGHELEGRDPEAAAHVAQNLRHALDAVEAAYRAEATAIRDETRRMKERIRAIDRWSSTEDYAVDAAVVTDDGEIVVAAGTVAAEALRQVFSWRDRRLAESTARRDAGLADASRAHYDEHRSHGLGVPLRPDSELRDSLGLSEETLLRLMPPRLREALAALVEYLPANPPSQYQHVPEDWNRHHGVLEYLRDLSRACRR
jgi:hypothetical protein